MQTEKIVKYEVCDKIRENLGLLCEMTNLTGQYEELSKIRTVEELHERVAKHLGVQAKAGLRPMKDAKYTLYGVPLKVRELVLLFGCSNRTFYTVVTSLGVTELKGLYGEIITNKNIKYTLNGVTTPLGTLARKLELPPVVVATVLMDYGTKELARVPVTVWEEKRASAVLSVRRKTEKEPKKSRQAYTFNGVEMPLREVANRLKTTVNALHDTLKRYRTREVTDIPKSELVIWWTEHTFTYNGRKISLEKIAKKYDIHISRVVRVFKDMGTLELTPRVMARIQRLVAKVYIFNGKEITLAEAGRLLKVPVGSIKRKCEMYDTNDISWLIKNRKIWEYNPALTWTSCDY